MLGNLCEFLTSFFLRGVWDVHFLLFVSFCVLFYWAVLPFFFNSVLWAAVISVDSNFLSIAWLSILMQRRSRVCNCDSSFRRLRLAVAVDMCVDYDAVDMCVNYDKIMIVISSPLKVIYYSLSLLYLELSFWVFLLCFIKNQVFKIFVLDPPFVSFLFSLSLSLSF